jgi:hypothetical protein
MATAQVFGKICQSSLQKLLPTRYISLTIAKPREGTLTMPHEQTSDAANWYSETGGN